MQELQKLFYRVNGLGADVYRIDLENRLRRLDLQKIAVIDVGKNEITAINGLTLSNEETDDMQQWQLKRQGQLELRSQNDINRLVEAMNSAANWIEQEASAAQIADLRDPVLMAMHDLRATIVRKLANNIQRGKP